MRPENELPARQPTLDHFGNIPKFTAPSRGEFVYRVLCAGIREGRFHPGARLCEENLARSLGVSRTPVREALGRLQARGLLEDGPGRGLVVVALGVSQITQLYATREILEGAAARFAALAATDAEIRTLSQVARECRDAAETGRTVRLNRRFHQLIDAAAHNVYLTHALGDLRDALALPGGTTLTIAGRAEAAFEEHAAIVRAIQHRDPELAEAAARAHVREARRLRLDLMAQEVPPDAMLPEPEIRDAG